MLIDEVISYCDEKYSLRGPCENCTHIGKCSGGCKCCLEEIHFPKGNSCDKKEYDCDNLINFYVCDYSYKYASEIWYLLRKSETINSMGNYNILSIGCGGCPDLMAFESYVEECGRNKTIVVVNPNCNTE